MEVIQDKIKHTLQICIYPDDLEKLNVIGTYITTQLKHLLVDGNKNTNSEVTVKVRPASEIQYALVQGRWKDWKNISTIIITNQLLERLREKGEVNTDIAKYKTQFILADFKAPIATPTGK